MNKRRSKKNIVYIILLILLGFFIFWRAAPEHVTYGVSFSKYHAEELKLDWKKVFLAILDDLHVKNFRLSAHWPNIEPKNGSFNFSDLDFQVSEVGKRGASVILAVGRRLPGWPECHEPEWTWEKNDDEKRELILSYITKVVERYKNQQAVKYWQIENEPFLTLYANYYCGTVSNEDFLKKEIALVKKLDPTRKIIITDSGELGLWYKAYRNADIFGTSLYLYIWNQYLGPIRYPIPPSFFALKNALMSTLYGSKQSFISELSAEPWLLRPILETPIEVQLKQMSIERFNKTINFARATGFDTQYLWGAEWWYYMKQNSHEEFWNAARGAFNKQ